jgi:hypothetical protein
MGCSSWYSAQIELVYRGRSQVLWERPDTVTVTASVIKEDQKNLMSLDNCVGQLREERLCATPTPRRAEKVTATAGIWRLKSTRECRPTRTQAQKPTRG